MPDTIAGRKEPVVRQKESVVINLNYTFFFQLINFIILLLLLRKFVFTPLRNFMAERDRKRQEWLGAARQDTQEAEELKNRYREMLTTARQQALELKTRLISEAQAEAAGMLESARNERSRRMIEGRSLIKKEKEASKSILTKDIDRLADQIVTRVAKT